MKPMLIALVLITSSCDSEPKLVCAKWTTDAIITPTFVGDQMYMLPQVVYRCVEVAPNPKYKGK